MSDERDDIDETGEPVAELALLRAVPPVGFRGRIGRVLGRRRFASQILDLGLVAPLIVALEFISTIFQALMPASHNGDSE